MNIPQSVGMGSGSPAYGLDVAALAAEKAAPGLSTSPTHPGRRHYRELVKTMVVQAIVD